MNIIIITLITACPIKGQVRSECASHPGCHRTCNTTGPVACLPVCIINGCECPDGTVIDEDKNECVAPKECEGIIMSRSGFLLGVRKGGILFPLEIISPPELSLSDKLTLSQHLYSIVS